MASARKPVSPDVLATLRARVGDKGFTPGLRELEGLLDLHADADEEVARAASKAVARIETRHRDAIGNAVVGAAEGAAHPARSRLARLLGELVREGAPGRPWLVHALADEDPKTRRAAARALSKLPADPSEEPALLAAWDAAERDEDRRSLAEALARSGSEAAAARLRSAAAPGHAAEPKIVRASLVLERDRARAGTPQEVVTDATPTGALKLRFHVRRGLEHIAADEIPAAWLPRVAFAGTVEATMREPLARALGIRTALEVGVIAPKPAGAEGPDTPAEVARILLGAETRELLRRFTRGAGPIRFRLAFARGGHRRAEVWRVAELVRASSPDLVNDPTSSTWEVIVHEHHGIELELVPKGFVDTRFAWRTGTVAASSHPTVAAAIARVAPRRDDDVVWDPFVGAGAELVERACVGPYARLLGTDTDPRALDIARENLTRARIDAELVLADATTHRPSGVTLVVSNPPMGRRVQRGTHGDVLSRFVAHAGRVLTPGGALVWIVPEPERIAEASRAAGFETISSWTLDMGGFPAELMVLRLRTRR